MGSLDTARPPPPLPCYLVLEVRLSAVFPPLKHVGQLVQATVMEVENLVLALPAGDDQLAAGAGLVAGQPRQGEGNGAMNMETPAFISKYNQRPLSLTSEAGNRKAPGVWLLAAGGQHYTHTEPTTPLAEEGKIALSWRGREGGLSWLPAGLPERPCVPTPYAPSSLGGPGVDGVGGIRF